jgi:hypothetical protein
MLTIPSDTAGTTGSSGAAAEGLSGDLNADVRDAASSYRDPAGAVQQDKFVDAVKGNSALPNSIGSLAEGNVPGFTKFKDSFKPESEKDPNAGRLPGLSPTTAPA